MVVSWAHVVFTVALVQAGRQAWTRISGPATAGLLIASAQSRPRRRDTHGKREPSWLPLLGSSSIGARYFLRRSRQNLTRGAIASSSSLDRPTWARIESLQVV